MKEVKGVVLEKNGSTYTVLTAEGEFRRVKFKGNAELGEEIMLPKGGLPWGQGRTWLGVAAVFLLVFSAVLGWNLYQTPEAAAYVSLDVNPSFQCALDSEGRLINIDALNPDGKVMLKGLSLKGKPLDVALTQLLNRSIEYRYVNKDQRWIILGISSQDKAGKAEVAKVVNLEALTNLVTETVKMSGIEPQVAVFRLSDQERLEAERQGLSLGEYALWQTARKAGVQVEPAQLKEMSERTSLLAKPQVQSQLQAVMESAKGTASQSSELVAKPSSTDLSVGGISGSNHNDDNKNKAVKPSVDQHTGSFSEEGKTKNENSDENSHKGGPVKHNDEDSVNKPQVSAPQLHKEGSRDNDAKDKGESLDKPSSDGDKGHDPNRLYVPKAR